MMRLPFAAGFPKLLSGVMRKQGPFYVQAQKLCTIFVPMAPPR